MKKSSLSGRRILSGLEKKAEQSENKVRKNTQERRKELRAKFENWPLVSALKMEMPELYPDRAIVSMPVPANLANDQGILPGMIVQIPANVAGVFLAMMNSENFTPLPCADLHWLEMICAGKDKTIVADARLIRAGKQLIVVEVKIFNEVNKLKAMGIFTFINS